MLELTFSELCLALSKERCHENFKSLEWNHRWCHLITWNLSNLIPFTVLQHGITAIKGMEPTTDPNQVILISPTFKLSVHSLCFPKWLSFLCSSSYSRSNSSSFYYFHETILHNCHRNVCSLTYFLHLVNSSFTKQ